MARKQHKYHYIYKTICSVTGKYYIGMHSTSNLEDGYIGSSKRLWLSINKHGRENHSKEILEFLESRLALKKKEAELVNEDILKDPLCMNLQPGGEGGLCNLEHKRKFLSAGTEAAAKSGKNIEKLRWLFQNDKDWKDKTLTKRSKSLKGRQTWWIGKTHTPESKNKISAACSIAQSGSKNSQFGKMWITNGTISTRINVGEQIPVSWVVGRIIKNHTK